ncbi:hypothetical protein HDU93_003401, partial [Gonapodya sp. JEL0774]
MPGPVEMSPDRPLLGALGGVGRTASTFSDVPIRAGDKTTRGGSAAGARTAWDEGDSLKMRGGFADANSSNRGGGGRDTDGMRRSQLASQGAPQEHQAKAQLSQLSKQLLASAVSSSPQRSASRHSSSTSPSPSQSPSPSPHASARSESPTPPASSSDSAPLPVIPPYSDPARPPARSRSAPPLRLSQTSPLPKRSSSRVAAYFRNDLATRVREKAYDVHLSSRDTVVYHPLEDPALKSYYENSHVRDHLVRLGLLSPSGVIIPPRSFQHHQHLLDRIESAARTLALREARDLDRAVEVAIRRGQATPSMPAMVGGRRSPSPIANLLAQMQVQAPKGMPAVAPPQSAFHAHRVSPSTAATAVPPPPSPTPTVPPASSPMASITHLLQPTCPPVALMHVPPSVAASLDSTTFRLLKRLRVVSTPEGNPLQLRRRLAPPSPAVRRASAVEAAKAKAATEAVRRRLEMEGRRGSVDGNESVDRAVEEQKRRRKSSVGARDPLHLLSTAAVYLAKPTILQRAERGKEGQRGRDTTLRTAGRRASPPRAASARSRNPSPQPRAHSASPSRSKPGPASRASTPRERPSTAAPASRSVAGATRPVSGKSTLRKPVLVVRGIVPAPADQGTQTTPRASFVDLLRDIRGAGVLPGAPQKIDEGIQVSRTVAGASRSPEVQTGEGRMREVRPKTARVSCIFHEAIKFVAAIAHSVINILDAQPIYQPSKNGSDTEDELEDMAVLQMNSDAGEDEVNVDAELLVEADKEWAETVEVMDGHAGEVYDEENGGEGEVEEDDYDGETSEVMDGDMEVEDEMQVDVDLGEELMGNSHGQMQISDDWIHESTDSPVQVTYQDLPEWQVGEKTGGGAISESGEATLPATHYGRDDSAPVSASASVLAATSGTNVKPTLTATAAKPDPQTHSSFAMLTPTVPPQQPPGTSRSLVTLSDAPIVPATLTRRSASERCSVDISDGHRRHIHSHQQQTITFPTRPDRPAEAMPGRGSRALLVQGHGQATTAEDVHAATGNSSGVSNDVLPPRRLGPQPSTYSADSWPASEASDDDAVPNPESVFGRGGDVDTSNLLDVASLPRVIVEGVVRTWKEAMDAFHMVAGGVDFDRAIRRLKEFVVDSGLAEEFDLAKEWTAHEETPMEPSTVEGDWSEAERQVMLLLSAAGGRLDVVLPILAMEKQKALPIVNRQPQPGASEHGRDELARGSDYDGMEHHRVESLRVYGGEHSPLMGRAGSAVAVRSGSNRAVSARPRGSQSRSIAPSNSIEPVRMSDLRTGGASDPEDGSASSSSVDSFLIPSKKPPSRMRAVHNRVSETPVISGHRSSVPARGGHREAAGLRRKQLSNGSIGSSAAGRHTTKKVQIAESRLSPSSIEDQSSVAFDPVGHLVQDGQSEANYRAVYGSIPSLMGTAYEFPQSTKATRGVVLTAVESRATTPTGTSVVHGPLEPPPRGESPVDLQFVIHGETNETVEVLSVNHKGQGDTFERLSGVGSSSHDTMDRFNQEPYSEVVRLTPTEKLSVKEAVPRLNSLGDRESEAGIDVDIRSVIKPVEPSYCEVPRINRARLRDPLSSRISTGAISPAGSQVRLDGATYDLKRGRQSVRKTISKKELMTAAVSPSSSIVALNGAIQSPMFVDPQPTYVSRSIIGASNLRTAAVSPSASNIALNATAEESSSLGKRQVVHRDMTSSSLLRAVLHPEASNVALHAASTELSNEPHSVTRRDITLAKHSTATSFMESSAVVLNATISEHSLRPRTAVTRPKHRTISSVGSISPASSTIAVHAQRSEIAQEAQAFVRADPLTSRISTAVISPAASLVALTASPLDLAEKSQNTARTNSQIVNVSKVTLLPSGSEKALHATTSNVGRRPQTASRRDSQMFNSSKATIVPAGSQMALVADTSDLCVPQVARVERIENKETIAHNVDHKQLTDNFPPTFDINAAELVRVQSLVQTTSEYPRPQTAIRKDFANPIVATISPSCSAHAITTTPQFGNARKVTKHLLHQTVELKAKLMPTPSTESLVGTSSEPKGPSRATRRSLSERSKARSSVVALESEPVAASAKSLGVVMTENPGPDSAFSRTLRLENVMRASIAPSGSKEALIADSDNARYPSRTAIRTRVDTPDVVHVVALSGNELPSNELEEQRLVDNESNSRSLDRTEIVHESSSTTSDVVNLFNQLASQFEEGFSPDSELMGALETRLGPDSTLFPGELQFPSQEDVATDPSLENVLQMKIRKFGTDALALSWSAGELYILATLVCDGADITTVLEHLIRQKRSAFSGPPDSLRSTESVNLLGRVLSSRQTNNRSMNVVHTPDHDILPGPDDEQRQSDLRDEIVHLFESAAGMFDAKTPPAKELIRNLARLLGPDTDTQRYTKSGHDLSDPELEMILQSRMREIGDRVVEYNWTAGEIYVLAALVVEGGDIRNVRLSSYLRLFERPISYVPLQVLCHVVNGKQVVATMSQPADVRFDTVLARQHSLPLLHNVPIYPRRAFESEFHLPLSERTVLEEARQQHKFKTSEGQGSLETANLGSSLPKSNVINGDSDQLHETVALFSSGARMLDSGLLPPQELIEQLASLLGPDPTGEKGEYRAPEAELLDPRLEDKLRDQLIAVGGGAVDVEWTAGEIFMFASLLCMGSNVSRVIVPLTQRKALSSTPGQLYNRSPSILEHISQSLRSLAASQNLNEGQLEATEIRHPAPKSSVSLESVDGTAGLPADLHRQQVDQQQEESSAASVPERKSIGRPFSGRASAASLNERQFDKKSSSWRTKSSNSGSSRNDLQQNNEERQLNDNPSNRQSFARRTMDSEMNSVDVLRLFEAGATHFDEGRMKPSATVVTDLTALLGHTNAPIADMSADGLDVIMQNEMRRAGENVLGMNWTAGEKMLITSVILAGGDANKLIRIVVAARNQAHVLSSDNDGLGTLTASPYYGEIEVARNGSESESRGHWPNSPSKEHLYITYLHESDHPEGAQELSKTMGHRSYSGQAVGSAVLSQGSIKGALIDRSKVASIQDLPRRASTPSIKGSRKLIQQDIITDFAGTNDNSDVDREDCVNLVTQTSSPPNSKTRSDEQLNPSSSSPKPPFASRRSGSLQFSEGRGTTARTSKSSRTGSISSTVGTPKAASRTVMTGKSMSVRSLKALQGAESQGERLDLATENIVGIPDGEPEPRRLESHVRQILAAVQRASGSREGLDEEDA